MGFRKILGATLFSVSLTLSPLAQAQRSERLDSASQRSKIYLLTATYGVVAGTLTGLGSLAFYDKPSDHSRNIAMGASLGLYVGLLLGAYMIYSVPGPGSSPSGSPASPGSKPSTSGPVLDDPLRLDTSLKVQPLWAPYLAYNEQQKSMYVGITYLY